MEKTAAALIWTGLLIASLACATARDASAQDDLSHDFAAPPLSARTQLYWWWLNGNVTKQAITKDLEWMKPSGMGGGLICRCGRTRPGRRRRAQPFGSPAWRELLRHAVQRGGPFGTAVQPGAPERLEPWRAVRHARTSRPSTSPGRTCGFRGRSRSPGRLPMPRAAHGFYRDYVRAGVSGQSGSGRRPGAARRFPPAPTLMATRLETMLDGGDERRFWVSGGQQAGEGPIARAARVGAARRSAAVDGQRRADPSAARAMRLRKASGRLSQRRKDSFKRWRSSRGKRPRDDDSLRRR